MVKPRREFISRLLQARNETDALFQLVRPEALYDRPIPERHRIVFYVGHLEAFDWNLLSGPCGLTSFHPEFDRLFAFGIDPVGGDLPTDEPQDWPPLHAVKAYCNRIRQSLDDLLESAPLPEEGDGSFFNLLNIAIEHRLMHAETLAYMLHQLPFERKQGAAAQRTPRTVPVVPESRLVPPGSATLGLSRDSDSFGWDNEFEAHSTDVPEFTIDRHKITNSQFLRFLEDGGYEERSFWCNTGWQWIKSRQITHPVFWVRRGDRWAYRSMFDEIPLPPSWPVYVSHAEAEAFAKWAGKALPTEAQWHRAAYGTAGIDEREYPWGDELAPAADRCPAADAWDPAAVHMTALPASAFGVEGLIANGWEWTSTLFAPFAGFRPSAHYPGYSAPFFDGQHHVLKGGSVRTAACMLRRSFRNWFQPCYQYIYAGFRCVSRH